MSWRKIFLVEGIITTGIGTICLFIIPADPEISRLLTNDERTLALNRIAADRVVGNFRREKTTLRLVLRAFNFNVSTFGTFKHHAHPCKKITGCFKYAVLYIFEHFFPRIKLVYANHHCDT